MTDGKSKTPFTLNASGPWRFLKAGPGVVGRTSPVAIGAIVALMLAIWAVSDNSYLVMWLVLGVIFVSTAFCGAAFWYANKHPQHASLEGAELVEYAAIQQAARDPKTIDLEAESTANTAPPIGITHDGGKNGE